MNLGLTVGGYAASAVLLFLWLGARDAVIEEREGCNTASVQAALDAERISHVATKANYEQLVADLKSKAELERKSRQLAQASEIAARADTEDREETIDRLMLEASIDDIPDSSECLNVFVPERSLDRMRVRTTDCSATGGSAGSGADQVCADTGGTDRTDIATGDFSDITYGDSLILWGRDRDSIQILNGRMQAIRSLEQ